MHSKRIGAVRASPALAYAALATAGCLWGTSFVLGKVALAELSVGHMILYRFLFASLGLMLVLRGATRQQASARQTRIAPRDWVLFAAAAVLGVPVQFLLQYSGLARTTVAHASLVVAVAPVIMAGAAALLRIEHLTRIVRVALGTSTVGAVLIALGTVGAGRTTAATGPTLLGDALVLVSLFAAVGWVLLSRVLMSEPRGYSPMLTTVYVLLMGTAFLVVWVVWREGLPPFALSPRAWLAVAAQGLLGTTLTSLLWNWGLSRVSPSRASVFINLEPAVGTTLGVLLFHDSLGAHALAGGALVITAALVVTTQSA